MGRSLISLLSRGSGHFNRYELIKKHFQAKKTIVVESRKETNQRRSSRPKPLECRRIKRPLKQARLFPIK